MKYIILGLLCLLSLSISIISIIFFNKTNNNIEIQSIDNKINNYKNDNKNFNLLDNLKIHNTLNGSFFIYNDNIYCIGREYEKSPLSIFNISSSDKKCISKIKINNYILEDPKYLGNYDKHHYFIAVNAEEYFSIWKKSNDTNENYNIYQCIIKTDEKFRLIDIWNITSIQGLKLNKIEKNWKALNNINNYKIKMIYDQDNFTVIEGDLKHKNFKFLYDNKKINKSILNKIDNHELKKKPYIRGGIPVINYNCNMYFINHLQVIKNNEINYRLSIFIYNNKFELIDNIIFDSIFNNRIEYPTSAFIVDENIFISFGIADKYTRIEKYNLYDLIVNEKAITNNTSKKKLYFNIKNEI